ncbi:hypothetical protein K1T71_005604 [Dendrolimus kikuchii]|uniref:Uncharacterized protein n=1 Tax=Dendrolimus kikuchii TaxID=765133 RepID=A0ACC1D4H2_9NEOP|nr:hypothetical protein K1T71_005604 [Dendrolimus kikuchii]
MLLELRRQQDQVINLELENRNIRGKFNKITQILKECGYNESTINDIINKEEIINYTPESVFKDSSNKIKEDYILVKREDILNEEEIKNLIEENEGLRKGLEEILEILKDNSTTSSGILTLQCSSLEKVLQSMEARHACGWFAPHMTTIMELKSAQGGKDALLVALHQARYIIKTKNISINNLE